MRNFSMLPDRPVMSRLERFRPGFLGNFPRATEEPMPQYQIELPAGITKTMLVEAVAGSAWAQDAAEGVVKVLGLSGAAREEAKRNWAMHMAQGFVEGGVATSSAARRRREEEAPARTERRRGRPRVPRATTPPETPQAPATRRRRRQPEKPQTGPVNVPGGLPPGFIPPAEQRLVGRFGFLKNRPGLLQR